MRAEQDALTCCPPGRSDDAADVARPQRVAIPSGTSTTVIDIGYVECWVTITADVNCLLRCDSSVSMSAAIDGDFPIWQFSYQQYWISANDRYLRVKGTGTGGFFYVYRSQR